MILSKIKYKNQITIPAQIAKLLKLKQNDVVSFVIKKGQIVIIPVHVEPRYTVEEIKAIDKLVTQEKRKAKVYKVGNDFEKAIEEL